MKTIFLSLGATVIAGTLNFSSSAFACAKSASSNGGSKAENCSCDTKDHKACTACGETGSKEAGKTCGCKLKTNKS